MDKTPEECKTSLERWLYIMKNMGNMDAIPEVFMKDPIFKDLEEVAQVAVLNEEERKKYDHSLKQYQDWYAIVETATTEGREEGRKEGREEEKLEIALKLIKMGFSDDEICQATALSESKVLVLRNRLNLESHA